MPDGHRELVLPSSSLQSLHFNHKKRDSSPTACGTGSRYDLHRAHILHTISTGLASIIFFQEAYRSRQMTTLQWKR
jgi:hypothetical protein